MYSKGIFRDIIIPFGGFVLTIALLFGVAGLLSGCSSDDPNDSAYIGGGKRHYTYAYIKLPNNEVVEGTIDDYVFGADDGGVRVKVNGNWYYTSNVNCVLTDKKPE